MSHQPQRDMFIRSIIIGRWLLQVPFFVCCLGKSRRLSSQVTIPTLRHAQLREFTVNPVQVFFFSVVSLEIAPLSGSREPREQESRNYTI